MNTEVDISELFADARHAHDARQLKEAERLYRKIVALDERHDPSWHGLALIAHDNCRTDLAGPLIAKTLALRGDVAAYHATRGAIFERMGRLEVATASYQHAVTFAPDDIGNYRILGTILGRMGKLEEAAAIFERAVALDPDDAAVQYNFGLALERQGKHEQALARYERALELNPSSADILNSMSMALYALSRLDEALAAVDRALALRPGYSDAWNNRGTSLLQSHQPHEALASYTRALSLSPTHTTALLNRGNALVRLNRCDDALADYLRAQAFQPNFAELHWSESLCRLRMGDFRKGWEKYEWRWQVRPQTVRNFTCPLWQGLEDISGKTIMLHAEQGFGDALQFCRYVPMVAARGAKVMLEVPSVLKPLMATLGGVSELYDLGAPLPDTDYHCPLVSLPLAFDTTLATIPAATPYLAPPADASARWRERLREIPRPRVGLAWRAGERHIGELHRSIPPAMLTPLLGSGVSIVSLQKDMRPEDREWLSAHPEVRDFGENLADFADTAAIAAEMDLVISVDTSVAHLAGALGLPVWIFLSYIGDWRWMADRPDSPWYPTARLYRQSVTNDWSGVTARVAEDLRNRLFLEAQKP